MAYLSERKEASAPASSGGVESGLLGMLKAKFTEAESMLADGRFVSMRNRDYYDGAQWTAAEVEALRLRKQAPIVINRVKRKVDFLVGMEIRTRTDPQVLPRTEVEEGRASVFNDVVRFIQTDTRAPIKFTGVTSDVFIEGMGGVEVIGVQKKRGVEVQINHLQYNSIFYDPRSVLPNFEDAAYKGVAKWIDADVALSTLGRGDDEADTARRQEAINAAFSDVLIGNGFHDRPEGQSPWASSDRRRLLIVSIYYRANGVWNYAAYTGGGIIESGVSPYLDDEDEPECPYIFTSCYVRKRTNDRYGVVSDMIGPQDEINHRRSKLLHMLSVRQVKAEEGAVEDVDKARRQLARPDAWITVKPNKMFEVLENGDQISGQAELLQEAKNEIEQLGPNAGLIGRGVEDQSGRAILAQQQSGMTELALPYDNLRDFREATYRAAVNRARQFWTEEKVIRVTDDVGAPKFVTLNKATPVVDPTTGGIAVDPATGQPAVSVENSMSDMDVDIIVGEGADVATIAAEQFDKLLELAKFGIVFPPEFYVKASSLRNKRELVDALKKGTEVSPEQQAQQQDEKDMLQEKVIADIHKTNSQAAQAAATAKKINIEADAMRFVNHLERDPQGEAATALAPPPGVVAPQIAPGP